MHLYILSRCPNDGALESVRTSPPNPNLGHFQDGLMLQVVAQFHPCHSWYPSYWLGCHGRPIRGYIIVTCYKSSLSPRNLCHHDHQTSTSKSLTCLNCFVNKYSDFVGSWGSEKELRSGDIHYHIKYKFTPRSYHVKLYDIMGYHFIS